MSKRPNVFDLDSLLIKKPEPAAPPAAAIGEEKPAVAAPSASVAVAEKPTAPIKSAPAKPPEMFRTSVYFSRAVHDKLRDIAHHERKSVTDLINEGLDHVLTSRNYKPTSELRKKK